MSGQTDPVLCANKAGIERRVAPRYGCSLTTSCRLMAAVPGRIFTVRVRNISATGISLVVGQALEPGAVFEIELRSVSRNVSRLLGVRTVYCIEHPCGELILGGAFAEPLSEEELRVFLK